MRFECFSICILICALVVPAHAQRTNITSDLIFYASFNKSLQPDNYAGASQYSGKYQRKAGRVGPGFNSQATGAEYGFQGNFNPQEGSLSFWFKPTTAMDQNGHLFRTNWFELTADVPKQKLFFMTGAMPGGDFMWDYSLSVPLSQFSPKRWTHVAVTWGKNADGKTVKTLYINGKSTGAVAIAPMGETNAEKFHFGSYPGVYDELMIWKLPLSESEIKQLWTKPEQVARIARQLPPMVRERQWIVYPHLVYHEFPKALIAPGETIRFDLPLENRTDKPQTGKAVLTLLDVWEKPVGQPLTVDFELGPKEKKGFPVQFTPERYGIFKVQAEMVVGDHRESRDVTSFASVPPGNPPKHPFFGLHIQQAYPEQLAMARRLGFSANRSHNASQYTWWRCMEYERGKWNLVQQDLYDQINAMGMDHLGQWFAAPHWAVTLPDGQHPTPVPYPDYPQGWVPTDMEAYKNYVRESIKRFPAITEWEIWNEPWCSIFWLGSPEDYVALCKASYEAAKSVRPDIKVYAQYTDSVWGKTALKAGLLKYCDGLTYHWYCGTGEWDDARNLIRAHRKLIGQYTSKNVPLMNSECGLQATTFLRGMDFPTLPPEDKRSPMNYREAAERIVQYYVTTMAEGVERWYYYYHTLDDTYSGWSTLETTRSPKPFAVALCMLTWQLDGGTFVESETLKGPLYAYLFDRKDGNSVAVVWTTHQGVVEMTIDNSFECFDLMGNPVQCSGKVRVTDSPMYLRFQGSSKQLAQNLKTAPIAIVKPPVDQRDEVLKEFVPQKMLDYSVALESGTNRLIPLDLRSVVNMGLADEKPNDAKGGWTDEGPFNDMRDLKPDRYTWLGVPVVVIDPAENQGKSVFTLRGTTFPNGPTASAPIPVGRKVRGLFFTHAANHAMTVGQKAGEYEILYTDGTKQTVPIVVGTNVFNWWHDHQEEEDSRTIPVKVSQPLEASAPYRYLRLWYWTNPKHDVAVKSITLKACEGQPGPTVILLGVTAAVW